MPEPVVAHAVQKTLVEFTVDAVVLGPLSAERLGVPVGTTAEPGTELFDMHQSLVREELGS